MPDYPDFVNTLKTLHIKKKGNRPKVSPQKFYPSQVELQTQELIREELGDYAYKLKSAAQANGVQGVYDVPGAVPQGFDEKVQKVAEAVSLFQVRAFANFSELAVGERYFPGGNEQRDIILNTWSDNFVNLCKSTNEEMRKRVAGVVSDGVLGGRNIRDLTKDIQNTCSEFTRNKAELIATTEVGKLNTAIARNQSEAAGIQFYEWSAAMDGRTRESHAVMDGKICKWGEDDYYYLWETDPKTGKRKLVRKPRPANAYKGPPGTDFRCRCTALPYVPEYEDDYEAERPKGPVHGVTQGEHADPETKKILEELARTQVLNRLKKREKKSLDVAIKFSNRRKDKDAKFIKVSPFIYSDKRRIENHEKNKIARETEMSEIAVKNGYPVVFLAELHNQGEKNPDSVMGGLITEFKKCVPNKIEERIREGLSQASNVFVRIDGDMPVPSFYKELKRVVNNIRKENIVNAKDKERAKTVKKNLKGATLFLSIGDYFNSVNLDRIK